MISKSDILIARYQDAYHELYNEHSVVEKYGSWIYINGDSNACRAKRDLPSIINKLKRRIRERVNFDNLIKKTKQIQHEREIDNFRYDSNNPLWKKYIKKDLMEMFFQKLFENNGHSAFQMERAMKDYALGGGTTPYIKKKNDCDECYLKDELDSLEDESHDIRNENTNLTNTIHDLKDKIIEMKDERENLKDEITDMKDEHEKLKENSVFFSMDDLKDIVPKKILREKQYNDFDPYDDAPF